jgi:hypothetical protein
MLIDSSGDPVRTRQPFRRLCEKQLLFNGGVGAARGLRSFFVVSAGPHRKSETLARRLAKYS